MKNLNVLVLSLVVFIMLSTLAIPVTAQSEDSKVSEGGEIPQVTLISNHTQDDSDNGTTIPEDVLREEPVTIPPSSNTTNLETNNSTTNLETNNSTVEDNTSGIVCQMDGSGKSVETEFGSVVKNILEVIVVLSAFFAVFGGTFYTAASAARPSSKEEYHNRRNLSILYGLLILVIIYGIIVVVEQVNSDFSFSCISPEF